VTSYTLAPETREKANSDERATLDEGIRNNNDIQGSQENRSNKQLCFLAEYGINHSGYGILRNTK
jgi:hypothetical protein